MSKLNLKKPLWAEQTPEKEWLDKIFNRDDSAKLK